MPSPELVQRVDALAPIALNDRLYRLTSSHYPPLSGEGARTVGGRWNPRESFPTLYLASDMDTAVAEVARGFAAQGRSLDDAVGFAVFEIEVRLSAVLDMSSDESLAAVGLRDTDVQSPDRRRCQAVGDAAHFVGLEGVRSRSGVGSGFVVAVFLDNQKPTSVITPGPAKDWR